jgi:carboxymethylenebutenolidase
VERKQASEFDQELLNLFDRYVHGGISRREFLDGAARFAVGGLTAAALFESLRPRYAFAEQVSKDDDRLKTQYVNYASPQGSGKMRGYLVQPVKAKGKLPAIVVVHENRGLNPYIEDVARRLGVEGFLAFAPDGLTPVGGYPGNDEEGLKLQAQLDGGKMFEDFVAAVAFLKSHPQSTGKVGIVGFCYGGSVSNKMAIRVPDLAAAVPFYGGAPPLDDVAKIKAPMLLHFAGLDERVNAGWPAFEAALKKNNVKYQAFIYEGVNHGFHNDTTPRYDEKAASLAWERTLDFFKKNVK